jgi:hypothetical protein
MSDLDRVDSLCCTVARTVGLELLMVPVGPVEVMVTPRLEPPRLAPEPGGPAPLRPPALLFRVDPPLPLSLSRLLGLPTRDSLLACHIYYFLDLLLSHRFAAYRVPDP